MSSVSCESCAAACCVANTAMPLISAEVQFMEQSGTRLFEVVPAIPDVNWSKTVEDWDDEGDRTVQEFIKCSRVLEAGYGLYILKANCANLVERDGWLQCSAYDNPDRPRICREFQVGSISCLGMRIKRGVDTGEKAMVRFTKKLPRLLT